MTTGIESLIIVAGNNRQKADENYYQYPVSHFLFMKK
jgi:hypothetical protein